MSKLLDMLRNAARARGRQDSSAPSALLTNALRRAADERAALRALSPSIVGDTIDVEDVEDAEVTRIQAEAEAEERLAAAARERAAAEELALQTAHLRIEAEGRANRLAKEREETERSAAEAMEERLRLENESTQGTADEDPEKRRLKRGLLFTIAALVLIGAVIVFRNLVPVDALHEHGAPLFKLEHELKTPPDAARK